MSLKSDHDLATSQEFRERLRIALCKNAIAVAQDTGNAKYSSRIAFAREFLRNPEDWTARISFFVAASDAIDSSSTDSQIQAVVAVMWDSISAG